MWTLYCPNGRVASFHIKGCAELYKRVWGGTLVYENTDEFKEIEPPSELQKLVA